MGGTSSLPSLVPAGRTSFGLSLAFPFCLWCDGSGQVFLLDFLTLHHLDCDDERKHLSTVLIEVHKSSK